MKKTIILSAALVSLTTVAFGTTASAAPDSVFGTNGVVTFKADTEANLPLDPTNPKPDAPVTPIDPTQPVVPGTGAPLSIDYASSFDFGTQTITTIDANYKAAAQAFADGSKGPNYVQITDKRGTLEGWSLSVKQNGQFKTGNNDILTGAVISFANAGVASDMTVDTPSSTPGTVLTNLTLDPDAAAETVVTAGANQGMGTWIYRFGADATQGATSVNLLVPGSTVKRVATKYSTSLTWSLQATPAN